MNSPNATQTAIASRNPTLCRKEYEVWLKWISTFPAASAPVTTRRQERAHADRRGDADALEDVEDEMHRAVP